MLMVEIYKYWGVNRLSCNGYEHATLNIHMLSKVITILFLSGDPIPAQKIGELLSISKEEVLENAPFLKTKLEELGLTLLITSEGLCITTQAGRVTATHHGRALPTELHWRMFAYATLRLRQR